MGRERRQDGLFARRDPRLGAAVFHENWQEETVSPLSDDVRDLLGSQTIGLYPLLQDDTCWFVAVIRQSWERDACAFLERAGGWGPHRWSCVVRERAHVWIFFANLERRWLAK